jgi:hypothetical protein
MPSFAVEIHEQTILGARRPDLPRDLLTARNSSLLESTIAQYSPVLCVSVTCRGFVVILEPRLRTAALLALFLCGEHDKHHLSVLVVPLFSLLPSSLHVSIGRTLDFRACPRDDDRSGLAESWVIAVVGPWCP